MLPFIFAVGLVVYGFAPLSHAQSSNGSVKELIGAQVQDLEGRSLGELEEVIVDVRGGQAQYLIVRAGEEAHTLPFRAIAEEVAGPALRVDMKLAGALARQASESDPRFRRASRLIGQNVMQPGGEVVGRIRDLQLDMASGEVKRVLATTPEGPFGFPPTVLAQGYFPPLTRWQAENPSPEPRDGYVEGESSRERRSLQGGRAWERD